MCVCVGAGGGVGRQGAGLDVNGQKFQKRVCGERRGSKHTKTMTSGGALTPNRSTQIRNNTTINTCNMRRKSTGGRWGGGRGTPGVIPLAGKGHVMQQRLVGRELDLHKDARCKLGQKHLCPKFFRLFVQKLWREFDSLSYIQQHAVPIASPSGATTLTSFYRVCH